MKKIFCIVAAVIIAFVGVLITTFACVKKSLGFNYGEPYCINIYYKGSTTIHKDGGSYFKEDKEYINTIASLKKSTKTSLLNLLLKTGSVKYDIQYGGEKYATYDTEMKSKNMVIELIYKQTQNVVVYENGNSRVIPYTCLLFIIPCEKEFQEIVIYYSEYNDSTIKEKEYKENIPFIINSNPSKILKYVESINVNKTK